MKMKAGDTKSDMDRLGVFMEMSYISIGEKYSPPYNRPFNESAYRNKQMQVGTAGQQCALQTGFFDKSFQRIFEQEALNEPLRLARQNRIQQAKKNLGKAFMPCNGIKKPCGSGTYYGTLSGPVEAMSPLSVPQKLHHSPGRNILTSPPKKGSGYSYPNVTLSQLDLYSSEPYNHAREDLKREAAIHRSKFTSGPFKVSLHPKEYFQGNPYHSDKLPPSGQKSLPSLQKVPPQKRKVSLVPFKPSSLPKRAGGMKAGTFGSYPSHSTDPYTRRRSKMDKREPIFRPGPGPKSTPIKSIITINVNRRLHSDNYMSPMPAVMNF